ncbi:hypothetical protein LEP1GSC171_0026 [Leptospira santarosai str. HAI1380]|nr:hypothetical protein LEP1GSC171_0026 [Leptospira santarosai str. HAI1380]
MKLKHDNRSISIPFLKSSMAGLIRRIMIREFFSLGDGSYIQRIPVSDFTRDVFCKRVRSYFSSGKT